MSLPASIAGQFRGRLGLRTFTDRREFEVAAKRFLGTSRHNGSFKVGETVYFDYDERPVAAEVWSEGYDKGSYWVRGDDGVTYLISGKVRGWRHIQPCTNLGQAIGKDAVRRLRGAA